jgi:hypothetical protein
MICGHSDKYNCIVFALFDGLTQPTAAYRNQSKLLILLGSRLFARREIPLKG